MILEQEEEEEDVRGNGTAGIYRIDREEHFVKR